MAGVDVVVQPPLMHTAIRKASNSLKLRTIIEDGWHPKRNRLIADGALDALGTRCWLVQLLVIPPLTSEMFFCHAYD